MWKSLASSPVTCLIHDKWLCEKPWMKTISGPLGLPQSCAEIVSPSGVFTQTCLNLFSCAMVGTALAARMSVAMDLPARRRTNDRCVMTNGPPLVLSAAFTGAGQSRRRRASLAIQYVFGWSHSIQQSCNRDSCSCRATSRRASKSEAWAELRDLAGRYRVEVGSFPSVALARCPKPAATAATAAQGPTYPKFSATTHAWHQPRPRPLYPPGAMHAAQWPRSTASSSRILEDAQAQAASTNTPKHADRAYSLPASVTLRRDQQQCRAISIAWPLDVGDNKSRAVLFRVFRLKLGHELSSAGTQRLLDQRLALHRSIRRVVMCARHAVPSDTGSRSSPDNGAVVHSEPA